MANYKEKGGLICLLLVKIEFIFLYFCISGSESYCYCSWMNWDPWYSWDCQCDDTGVWRTRGRTRWCTYSKGDEQSCNWNRQGRRETDFCVPFCSQNGYYDSRTYRCECNERFYGRCCINSRYPFSIVILQLCMLTYVV